jgi:hypothetical protein
MVGKLPARSIVIEEKRIKYGTRRGECEGMLEDDATGVMRKNSSLALDHDELGSTPAPSSGSTAYFPTDPHYFGILKRYVYALSMANAL